MHVSYSRIKTILSLFLITTLYFGCSARQDEANFKRYLSQDTQLKGKVGVLLSALGQPEEYEFEFFNNYLQLIFNSSFPPLLKFIILRDKGTVLRDPGNLAASVRFTPETLIDCFGKTSNSAGVPYTDLAYSWVTPRGGITAGYFLLKEKNGYVDIIEKTGIKMLASYYARMPGRKVPFMQQHNALFADIIEKINNDFPGMPVRTGWTMYPQTITEALDELLQEQAETIVVCDLFPVYSSLEQFNSLYVEIQHHVGDRAHIVYTPFPGAFEPFRKAYVTMAAEEISKLSDDKKKLVILTCHGMPEITGEPYHDLARIYYGSMKKEVEDAVRGSNTEVVIADIEFAGEERDPDNEKLSAAEAVKTAIEKKYDAVVLVLVDFMTENTDTVYCAREEALEPIGFSYEGTVPYSDFTKPFRTETTRGKTTFIIAGTPVGDRYRPHVAQGVYAALETVLKGRQWPELVVD